MTGVVVSAFVASLWCMSPLFLLAVGISEAWISNLAALTPYRPIFIKRESIFEFGLLH
jgi:mercuric ion transport protein